MEKIERAEAPDWHNLLVEAVQDPGQLAAAHKYFHKYSLANQWMVASQLRAMGLPLMPINTFKGWLEAKRPVQKEQKVTIAMIAPVPIREKKAKDADGAGTTGGSEKGDVLFTLFKLRYSWFHMGQTAGEEYNPEAVTRGDWSLKAALDLFEIKEAPFEFTGINDHRLGWAKGQEISVSPLESHQTYGRLREMARIVLGHTAVTPTKAVPMEQELRDIEADTTAYLCAATLGFDGLDEARARLQMALDASAKLRIPDKCANRAFSAADKMLNAGYC